MRAQDYLELKERQQKEINEFPIAYAFDEKQLAEALEKLGVKDISECVTVCGHGDIMKKDDAPKFVAMLKRHTKEVQDALVADKDFALEAFLYEMDNHEYAINYDGDGDVLGCFGLEMDELETMGLDAVYQLARKKHFDHMREWGVL